MPKGPVTADARARPGHPRAQDADRHVGARVRERRIALGLTQEALVIERGRIAHRGPSRELASNEALLERHLGVRAEAD